MLKYNQDLAIYKHGKYEIFKLYTTLFDKIHKNWDYINFIRLNLARFIEKYCLIFFFSMGDMKNVIGIKNRKVR